jgi:predicted O-methyltransferase YrrM
MPYTFKWHKQAIDKMPDGMIRGRNIKEGYIRGCGLVFGDMTEHLLKDKYFTHAFNVARSRKGSVTDLRLCNLWLLVKYHLENIQGNAIVEFGTANGSSAFLLAIAAHLFRPDLTVICFDTFSGMPDTDTHRDAHSKGDFSEANYDELVSLARDLGLTNLIFVKGMLQETAPSILPQWQPIRLAHIDVDIYSSISDAYNIVKHFMAPGGYFVFDDPLAASCLGAFEAVEDLLIVRDGLHAEQVEPQLVFRAPLISAKKTQKSTKKLIDKKK